MIDYFKKTSFNTHILLLGNFNRALDVVIDKAVGGVTTLELKWYSGRRLENVYYIDDLCRKGIVSSLIIYMAKVGLQSTYEFANI